MVFLVCRDDLSLFCDERVGLGNWDGACFVYAHLLLVAMMGG